MKGSYTKAEKLRFRESQALGERARRASRWVKVARGMAARPPPGKNPSDCLLPLPYWSLLLRLRRLRLQLQADTNGALIATGNLSGGGSWASRRCWGPGCTPLSWPPTRSQPPSCPALLTSLLWALSLIHTSQSPPFSAAPSSFKDPSHCPSGGTPKLGLTPLGGACFALKCPFGFLREGFGRKF